MDSFDLNSLRDTVAVVNNEEEGNKIENRIWMPNSISHEITEQEYANFYKENFDNGSYLDFCHFTGDKPNYSAYLYIPDHDNKKKHNIQLFNDLELKDAEPRFCIPSHLKFLQGVINSDQLRKTSFVGGWEVDFENEVGLYSFRKKFELNCFHWFQKLSQDKEKYMVFFKNFGQRLKLCMERGWNKMELITLLRYYTSTSSDEMCSLSDYVSRMKPDQKDIYIIIGDTKEILAESVLTKIMSNGGFEVIFMFEPIDSLFMTCFENFNDKNFALVDEALLESLGLFEDEQQRNEREQYEKKFAKLCQEMQHILEKNVIVKKILRNLPCILDKQSFHRELRINPDHPIIEGLYRKVENDQSVTSLVKTLYEASRLTIGVEVKEPRAVASTLYHCISNQLDNNDPSVNDTWNELNQSIQSLFKIRKHDALAKQKIVFY